jgi:Bacteriophage related domain of unknown function
MADYAGAVAAMRARFEAAWAATTLAQFQNEDPPATPWPPENVPWVYFEVIQTASAERGVGLPGSKLWLTTGNVFVHVFVPLGYGLPAQLALTHQAGEIFRAATFYQDSTSGAKVVCGAPSEPGGASNADNGNWFGLTVSIPFEFYFIA